MDLGRLSVQALFAGALRKHIDRDVVVNFSFRQILALVAVFRSLILDCRGFVNLSQVLVFELVIILANSDADSRGHGD